MRNPRLTVCPCLRSPILDAYFLAQDLEDLDNHLGGGGRQVRDPPVGSDTGTDKVRQPPRAPSLARPLLPPTPPLR